MRSADIMEALTCAIEEKILGEWRHEGYIGGFTSNYIDTVIDGREYVLILKEVADGHSFSDYIEEG